MNIKSKCAILLALAVALGMFGARPASAQLPPELEALRKPVPADELQKFSSDITTLVRVVSAMRPNDPEVQRRAAALEQKLANLPPEALTILANAYDRPAWSQVVERLRSFTPEADVTPPLAAAGRVSGETVASYPISPSTTTLVTADYGDCSPGTNATYEQVGPPIPSDTSYVYRLLTATEYEQYAQVVLNYSCGTIVEILGEGTNAFFCLAATIADEVLVVTQQTITTAQFCDSNVLAAENDAIYSNTFAVFNNLANTQSAIVEGFSDVESQVNSVNSNLTNEGLVLSSNILQAQAELDTRVNKVDTDVTTGTSQVDSNIATLQALELRIEIERSLSLGISVGLFETPKAEGGYLEVVGTTVQTVINGLAASGQNVGNAQQWENYGNSEYAGGYYKAAYHDYLVAYQTAVK